LESRAKRIRAAIENIEQATGEMTLAPDLSWNGKYRLVDALNGTAKKDR